MRAIPILILLTGCAHREEMVPMRYVAEVYEAGWASGHHRGKMAGIEYCAEAR